MQKNTVTVGSSYTIGSHILPGEPMQTIGRILESKIRLIVLSCDKIIEGVKGGNFDFGFIESPIFDEDLIYCKWMEDELVLCSSFSLGETLDKEMLSHCQLLCRNEHSPTRQIINDYFNKQGISYDTFGSLMEIDNATAAIQSIKWSKPNAKNPTVAIVSKLAIEDELQKKELHQARIEGVPMWRDFFLIYTKEKENTQIENIGIYLKSWLKSDN